MQGINRLAVRSMHTSRGWLNQPTMTISDECLNDYQKGCDHCIVTWTGTALDPIADVVVFVVVVVFTRVQMIRSMQ